MKREDASIIIRAIAIGLFSVAIIAISCMLVSFLWHARTVEMEWPW